MSNFLTSCCDKDSKISPDVPMLIEGMTGILATVVDTDVIDDQCVPNYLEPEVRHAHDLHHRLYYV